MKSIEKLTCEKPVASTSFHKELNIFPLRYGARQGWLLPSLSFNIVLEVLAPKIKHEKEIKACRGEKKK